MVIAIRAGFMRTSTGRSGGGVRTEVGAKKACLAHKMDS